MGYLRWPGIGGKSESRESPRDRRRSTIFRSLHFEAALEEIKCGYHHQHRLRASIPHIVVRIWREFQPGYQPTKAVAGM
jgi:hypothetical protein